MFRLASLAIASVLLLTPAFAQAPAAIQEPAPWRMGEALGAPDWLTLRGEARLRYESVGNQFRAGGEGGDQALSTRLLLQAEADLGAVALGLELQDSRKFLEDAGSPLSGGLTNALDFLQAYARVDLKKVGPFETLGVKVGRQSLSIGSQRVLERTDMGNVIAAFTGLYAQGQTARGDALNVLLVSPVGVRPTARAELSDDDVSLDREEWSRVLWGAHWRVGDAFGALLPDTSLEAYLYRLDERDSADTPTPNRDYREPGIRVSRDAQAGQWDFDIEASWRFGSRRATSAASDTRDLAVNAHRVHADIGYTFDAAWSPRLSLDYDFATGDKDPNDARFDQYERLFGGRRGDLGATGIFGPFSPANLEAPGARIEFEPADGVDVRVAYKHVSLAQARDEWVGARVRDESGASGRFVGHALDVRVRQWLVDDSLRLEWGASGLRRGRFAKTAPNAAQTGDPIHGYASLTARF